jgi:hypothetical protein
MPKFPSLDWCRTVEAVALKDPQIPTIAKEWGGLSVGVVIAKGDGLPKDFCLFVKPHPTELRLEALRLCEDEDDLELEEPDYFFRVPYAICRGLLAKKLDPFDVLRKGQVRVEGDMKRLLALGQKYQVVGDRIAEQVETTF